MHDYGTEFTS
jgi:Ca2+-binding EF-hand superfamily protein